MSMERWTEVDDKMRDERDLDAVTHQIGMKLLPKGQAVRLSQFYPDFWARVTADQVVGQTAAKLARG